VFATSGPALFNGMGGVDLANARLVCETLGLEWDREMMTKILAAASAFLEARRPPGE